MNLAYILRRSSQICGLEISDLQQRAILVDWVNEAGKNIWERTDLPGALQEILVPVTTDSQIALPSYIATVRAMREHNTWITWKNNAIEPRYQENRNWESAWYSWRDKGTSPIMQDIVTASVLTLKITGIDTTPPTFTIQGATEDATLDSESLTPSESGWTLSGGTYNKTTTKAFQSIKSITKDTQNNFDLAVYDADGNLLAQLENNQLYTRYKIYDVSEFPFGGDCTNNLLARQMEVLYKPDFRRLENDEDSFQVDGMEDAIVAQTIGLFNEQQLGNEERAALFYTKAQKLIQARCKDQLSGKIMRVSPVQNPHDRIMSPYRSWPQYATRYG